MMLIVASLSQTLSKKSTAQEATIAIATNDFKELKV